MRLLKFALLAVLAVVAVLLAIANRAPVTLHLWPEGLARPAPLDAWPAAVETPLYVALLGAVFAGVVVGVALEMLRESGQRRLARRHRAEAQRLAEENRALRLRLGEDPDDDFLGLPAPQLP